MDSGSSKSTRDAPQITEQHGNTTPYYIQPLCFNLDITIPAPIPRPSPSNPSCSLPTEGMAPPEDASADFKKRFAKAPTRHIILIRHGQ